LAAKIAADADAVSSAVKSRQRLRFVYGHPLYLIVT
jgi:hypothetical protein